MQKNNRHPKNNLGAILFGFFLIIAVTVLFFVRSSYLGKKKQTNMEVSQKQEEADNLEKYSSVSPADLLEKINQSENPKIFDIRDIDSFSLGHIVGSESTSFAELGDNISSLDKNQDYYLVDYLGLTQDLQQVLDLFSKQGFKRVKYLEGGIQKWSSELNPIVEFGNPSSLSDQSKVNYISSEDLKDLITNEGDTLQLIDLRSVVDYSAGHLEKAINIPLENLEKRRKDIPNFKRIILYDKDGILAFRGAVRLFDMSVLNIFALSGGLDDWNQKSLGMIVK